MSKLAVRLEVVAWLNRLASSPKRKVKMPLKVSPRVFLGVKISFMPLAKAKRCVRFSMLAGLMSNTSPSLAAAFPL